MTMVLLLGVGVGHWLLYPFSSAAAQLLGWSEEVQRSLLTFHQYGLTPQVNLATLASFDRPLGPSEGRRVGALAGATVYALLAAGLWWRLGVRFGPVTGRHH